MSSVPEMPNLAQAVATYWQAIGVTSKLQPIDFNTHRAEYIARKVAGMAYPMRSTPETFYDVKGLMSTFHQTTTGGYAYEDAEQDKLINQLYAEPDLDKQAEIARRIYDRQYTEYRIVPIINKPISYATGPRVAEWDLQGLYSIDVHKVRLKS
jgi:peptide/nickel transport system substrate-binding protein